MKSREEKNKKIIDELEKEQKRETIIRYVKLIIKIFIVILILFFSLYFYTKYSSTIGIVVNEKRIKNKNIPESFNGVKVIHFSDLYYGSTITKNEIKKLVKIINLRKPDIVIYTGNLIDKKYKMKLKEQEEITKELKKINANIGMYAVNGKDDSEKYNTIMTEAGFKVLDNTYDLIYKSDNNPILIVGLSSLEKDTRNRDEAFKYFSEDQHNSNIYTISIMSETDDLDDVLSEYNSNLVLAGNSLNGEVRIPLIGGIIKQAGSSKYKAPYYKLNDTILYVSNGIGSPNIGFRLFNRPSINFFRLSQE